MTDERRTDGGGKWKIGKCSVGPETAKTNNSAFSATHTYIKLTLVNFFYFFFHAPSPEVKTLSGF